MASVIDAKHDRLYFITGEVPAKIIQIELSTFTHVRTLTLPAELGKVSCALDHTYHGHLYLGTGLEPARIVQVFPNP